MKRRIVLPKSVQVWMCYTKSGQMRRAMFTDGGYTDTYKGWTISWDRERKEYCAYLDHVRFYSPRKADVYKYVDGQILMSKGYALP